MKNASSSISNRFKTLIKIELQPKFFAMFPSYDVDVDYGKNLNKSMNQPKYRRQNNYVLDLTAEYQCTLHITLFQSQLLQIVVQCMCPRTRCVRYLVLRLSLMFEMI